MEDTRIYELDGMALAIPLRYAARSGLYIEGYREFIENTVFIPGGYPDRSSCRFYQRAGPHCWIGLCQNKHRILTPNKGG